MFEHLVGSFVRLTFKSTCKYYLQMFVPHLLFISRFQLARRYSIKM